MLNMRPEALATGLLWSEFVLPIPSRFMKEEVLPKSRVMKTVNISS